ncbi:MAG: hypothetical protein ACLQFR_27990 [Streptosporangiaceae bacterium]
MAFGNYGSAWIRERPNLRPKTVELYEYLLRRHLRPAFGNWPIRDIAGLPAALAPREYRREHTSYYAADGERHPATSARSADTARAAIPRE